MIFAQFLAPALRDGPLKPAWHVPLNQNWCCIPLPLGRKAPSIKWKQYQFELPPSELTRKWASEVSNVAIITGAISGLVVLDCDNELAVAEATKRGLPHTVSVRTARGQHFYFRHPGHKVGNRTSVFAGADVRGDGGFVVAPGSIHPTGVEYAWINVPGPTEIATMPDWLADELTLAPGQPGLIDRPRQHSPASCNAYGNKAVELELDLLRSASFGCRNDQLNKSAFALARLAAGGLIDGDEAKLHLISMATTIGLSAIEIPKTIESGWAAGLRSSLQQTTGPRAVPSPGNLHDKPCPIAIDSPGVSRDDFRAYMPAHKYIFMPSGEMWPAESVNSRILPVPMVDITGNPVFDRKGKPQQQLASRWLDQHRPVEQLTWAPGQPQVVINRLISDGGWITREGCHVFNLYRPPLRQHGDAKQAQRWIDHVRRIYPDDADHLILWLAHRVQQPSEKINHAVVMGGAQGIGKDTILEPVKAAIGPWNFSEVSPQHLLGRFNGFVKSVILRVSEARDLGDVDRYAFYDHMKTYTAAPPDVLRVDEKNIREYSVFNVSGVIITTNHKTNGIYLPKDDRRHYVAWSNSTRDEFSPDYWTELYHWFSTGGNGHVAAYLSQLPLDAFDAKAPPLKTPAFWDIVSAGQAPEDAELSDALESLSWPQAVTVGIVAEAACPLLRGYLVDRRNSRLIPHRFEEAGYVRVRNDAAKDGYFKVGDKRCPIYAKNTLSRHDQVKAVEDLISR